MTIKTCPKCKIKKSLKDFSPNKIMKLGVSSYCKVCHNQLNCNYRQQNKEKCRKYGKQYAISENNKKSQQKYRNTLEGHLRQVYGALKRRCNNSNCPDYKNYGGRGIKNLFNSSNEFVNYVINILKIDPRGLDIDRINNDSHYEPGNIRFVTRSKNLKNRRK